ncbi:hypothetical protein [Streptomyces thermoalcalitolerans]|uniref:Uncharacterized protein n=1 Tax=Streptomyces thermoalcalitolerans TaxID=65605 RepID=A0ABP3YZV6_9ACTN
MTGRPAMAVPSGAPPSGALCAVRPVGRPGSEADPPALAERLGALRPWRRTAGL